MALGLPLDVRNLCVLMDQGGSKHNIALMDQGASRPTFGCDELMCIACGFTEHYHTCNYNHDIALVDQGGSRPTFGSVLVCV